MSVETQDRNEAAWQAAESKPGRYAEAAVQHAGLRESLAADYDRARTTARGNGGGEVVMLGSDFSKKAAGFNAKRARLEHMLRKRLKHEDGGPFAHCAQQGDKEIVKMLAQCDAGDGLSWLARVYEETPVEIEPETRPERRLLPVIEAGVEHPDRERGRMMAGIPGIDPPDKLQLPGFPAHVPQHVPLLDLVDATGTPIMAKGRGAPLPMRIIVQALLAIPLQDRNREQVRLALTVEEFRNAFFPHYYRHKRHWPKLRDALLETDHAFMALADRWPWRILALRTWPTAVEGRPNDLIVFDAALPPGTLKSGPSVDLPALDAMGRQSSPKYRAYLAAQTLNWKPGRTRVKHPESGRWIWSRDFERYPVITRKDRRRLAFGANDPGNRTRKNIDVPWEKLPELVAVKDQRDPETGTRGWRILPAEVQSDAPGEDEAEVEVSTVEKCANHRKMMC